MFEINYPVFKLLTHTQDEEERYNLVYQTSRGCQIEGEIQ